MRFHQHPRLAHFFFLHLQDLLQAAHLLAHLLQQFVDGIHFQAAGFEAFDGVTNCHLLGGAHQNRFNAVLFARGGEFIQQSQN